MKLISYAGDIHILTLLVLANVEKRLINSGSISHVKNLALLSTLIENHEHSYSQMTMYTFDRPKYLLPRCVKFQK